MEKPLVLNAYQLLPGEACPAYAYRYRFLGSVSIDPHKSHRWTEELFARLGETKKRQTESMVVWRSRRVRHHKSNIEPWILATADKLLQTGSTGWDPYYGLNFIVVSERTNKRHHHHRLGNCVCSRHAVELGSRRTVADKTK